MNNLEMSNLEMKNLEMRNDVGYRHWRNRETWAAAVGVTVNPLSCEHVQALMRMATAASHGAYAPQWLLAEWLQEWVERNEPGGASPLYDELVEAALARVDWYQIAEHLLGEYESAERAVPLGTAL